MPEDKKQPSLGELSLLALGINGVIGVGIFFAPSTVAKSVPGTAGVLAYLLPALACLPVAITFARLGSRFKEDGGPYVFARAAFGPWAAYVVGWLAYVASVVCTSAVIRGLSQAVAPSAGWVRPIATLITLVLSALVLSGLKTSAWAWTSVTIAKLVPLGMLIAAWAWFHPPASATLSGAASGVGASTLLHASLVVLFSIQGFEIVPVPAGHVQNPKSVARATVLALCISAAFYALLHLACVRALPDLPSSVAPLADAAGVYGGPAFSAIVRGGTSVSALGVALGMVAMTPRYLSTLGRPDGLGPWIGACDSRDVPRRALVVTAVAVLGLVQLGSLDELFELSSIAVLAQYGSAVASLFVLARRRFEGLGRRDVVVGVLAGLSTTLILTGATLAQVLRALALVLVGVILQQVIARRVNPAKQAP